MSKRTVIVITCLLLAVISTVVALASHDNPNNTTPETIDTTYENPPKDVIIENSMTIKISINNQDYEANLEDNETARSFVTTLPQDFSMQELNGNEKYVYLDYTLPTDPSVPSRIEAGDIMLYGDNCLVIFYKSFATNYSYTRIGHIDNLPNLGNGDILARFEKPATEPGNEPR